MQRKKQLLGSIAAVALAAGVFGTGVKSASATPATLGFYPATDIYGKGIFHFDADSYGEGVKMNGVTSFGLTAGTGPDRDGILGRSEIGVDFIHTLLDETPRDADGDRVSIGNRLLFNAKTQLYNNDDSGVRLVTGVWGMGSDDIFAPRVGYVLGSKAFKWGRVHLGVAHSFDEDNVTAPSGNNDTTYLQLGYDRMLTKKLQFAVDWYSGKSAISGVQPTLYYYVNDKASFGLGWMRFNDKSVAPDRDQVYLCFDYNFGGGGGSSEPAPAATTAPAPPAAP